MVNALVSFCLSDAKADPQNYIVSFEVMVRQHDLIFCLLYSPTGVDFEEQLLYFSLKIWLNSQAFGFFKVSRDRPAYQLPLFGSVWQQTDCYCLLYQRPGALLSTHLCWTQERQPSN